MAFFLKKTIFATRLQHSIFLGPIVGLNCQRTVYLVQNVEQRVLYRTSATTLYFRLLASSSWWCGVVTVCQLFYKALHSCSLHPFSNQSLIHQQNVLSDVYNGEPSTVLSLESSNHASHTSVHVFQAKHFLWVTELWSRYCCTGSQKAPSSTWVEI